MIRPHVPLVLPLLVGVSALGHAQVPPAAIQPGLPGLPVTLSARNIPLGEALDQLGRQTGLRFTCLDSTRSATRVTLDADKQPLWQTLRALTRQANGASVLVRDPNSSAQMTVGEPGSDSGPFVVTATRVSRAVNFDQVSDKRTVDINFTVASDPSIRISSLATDSSPHKAVDDKGYSLLPSPPVPMVLAASGPVGSISYSIVSIRLQQPPSEVDAGHNIALLEGFIPATTETAQKLEAPFGKSIERQFPVFKATVTCDARLPAGTPFAEFPDRPQTVSLNITAHFTREPGASDAEWIRYRSALQQLQPAIADDANRPWRSLVRNERPTGSDLWFMFVFNAPSDGPVDLSAKPLKVSMSLPTTLQQVRIPYRFEYLIMP